MATLLGARDGQPVAIEQESGATPFPLVGEHASNAFPESLDGLGLPDELKDSHIAWDIGALLLSRRLCSGLDATLKYQRSSRLVYDCNRPPEVESVVLSISEVFEVPGNLGPDGDARQARADEIYLPSSSELQRLFATRKAEYKPCPLVTIHDFTPVYERKHRDTEIGILVEGEAIFAGAVLRRRQRDGRRPDRDEIREARHCLLAREKQSNAGGAECQNIPWKT